MEKMQASRQLADLAFRQAWQGVFVFMIPAAMAMIGGYYLDNRWQDGKTWTIIGLGLALVISWLIIWRRYVNFKKTAIKLGSNQIINQVDLVDNSTNH